MKKILCLLGFHNWVHVKSTYDDCGELWSYRTSQYYCSRCRRRGWGSQGDSIRVSVGYELDVHHIANALGVGPLPVGALLVWDEE